MNSLNRKITFAQSRVIFLQTIVWNTLEAYNDARIRLLRKYYKNSIKLLILRILILFLQIQLTILSLNKMVKIKTENQRKIQLVNM